MTHQQVIDNFVKEGQKAAGTYVKATKDELYSRIPARPYRSAEQARLAVRLNDDGLLVNDVSGGLVKPTTSVRSLEPPGFSLLLKR